MFEYDSIVGEKERKSFAQLISGYRRITVVSCINPDLGAIGTSLGIAHILAREGWKVEVVNLSGNLPRCMDFVVGFDKIGKRISYSDSLLISCNCRSPERLGLDDISMRTLVNIDHHPGNTMFAHLNIVAPEAASSSVLAAALLQALYGLDRESSTAFYAALLADTKSFTTSSVGRETFLVAAGLIEEGCDPYLVARNLTKRRSLASMRILGRALEYLRLRLEGRVALVVLDEKDMQECGAEYSDLEGIADTACSLASVEIGLALVRRKNECRISMSSKGVDISVVSEKYGGGGDRVAAGFALAPDECRDIEKRLLSDMERVLKKEFE
jgi:phosphoesterase RecJ-like protein